ncbi:MAG TPA: XRE family transcriptional regulator [Acidobacteriota bacterium]|jgi:transcriptional regulator with XRE-family HTH domain
MTKNFKHLLEKMPPEARTRAEAKAKKMINEMALDELRVARDLTQEHLAKILGVKQSAISKLERRTDMYVSTLQDMIKAMGGVLEIRAIFSSGTVRINHFEELRERKAG